MVFKMETTVNKLLSVFLDRLAERMTALVAGLVSSRVAGMHAAAQAEQQSDLEDLARRYEADGKPEIAQALRLRANDLVSADLASEGTKIVNLTLVPFTGPAEQGEPSELKTLPDFSATTARRRSRTTPNRDEQVQPGEEGQ